MRISSSHPLVLGSGSPRRRDLLEILNLSILVCAPHVDESRRDAESSNAYLDRIVRDKLGAVRAQLERDGIREGTAVAVGILVADTIVVGQGGDLLGKPRDASDARAMVARLAGRTHEVRTRFGLGPPWPGAQADVFRTVTTSVTFRTMEPAEITAYAETGDGIDKAGAYAIQGRAAAFIERIDGSYTNVVGLPLCEVFVEMRALGWIEDE